MSDKVKRIKDLLIEKLNLTEEQLKPEARFIDDLGTDSLDIVQFIMDLEEEFNIEIPDEVVENFHKVQDVYDYIEKKIN